MYKSLSPEDHVKHRSGMYIGDKENIDDQKWIYDKEQEKMTFGNVNYNPGLLKIICEIIDNTGDHSKRTGKVTNIKVSENNGEFTVYNDGPGIDCSWNEEHKMYTPQMIFGKLFTSSNYDDTQERDWIGTNGIGAKGTNIFSSKFKVETVFNNKKYIQTWKEGMKKVGKVSLKDTTADDYTKITFIPDYEFFSCKDITGTLKLVHKRTMDLSLFLSDVSVYWNNKKLKCSDFSKYMKMYIGNGTPNVVIQNKKWSVGFAMSPFSCYTQISFVNGSPTQDGGTHVEHVVNPIIKQITEQLKKKHADLTIRPNYVKDNLFVLICATVSNPTFDSQTKNKCNNKNFGTVFKIKPDELKKIIKLGITDNIVAIANAKASKALNKDIGKKKNKITIDKLDDAHFAGTDKGKKCTLIITEGDSAKTLAIAGLKIIGRDYYGVWPLRGKLLNIRNITAQKQASNKEIVDFMKIMGIKSGVHNQTLDDLRYGSVMIMTDQDDDGFHIKGLVLNALHILCPELIKITGFVKSMITPIVKAKKANKEICFYNMNEYKIWKAANAVRTGWTIKYYKGLGTSSRKEGEEYFTNMKDNVRIFVWDDDEQDSYSIKLAFTKDKGSVKKWSDKRKDWVIEGTKEQEEIDNSEKNQTITDYVNKQLRTFSIYDNYRSIPSCIDGFKHSLRKVLYCCIKRNLHKDIKVAQLAGYVSEHGAYHHGEASLHGTIINMAQDYVGSNNINLLEPSGQFGTRLMGGADSASPRYIHTRLTSVVSKIFRPEDNKILEYMEEDGSIIEPKYYIPTLPMVLINGSKGIGTGFSTDIPCFNPQDIKQNLLRIIRGEPFKEMSPWYKNFKGKIVKIGENKWNTYGIYEKKSTNILWIKELPINKWTENYKKVLDDLESEKKIESYKNDSSTTDVSFYVKMKPSELNKLIKKQQVYDFFKLKTNISATNMYLFDKDNIITKFLTIESIMRHYYEVRLDHYKNVRKNIICTVTKNLERNNAKVRYIKEILDRTIEPFGKKKSKQIEILKHREYPELDGYEYIFAMKIENLTMENIEKLEHDTKEKEQYLENVKNTGPSNMWENDINEINI